MTFMMLDADVVACSPASVYRVLKKAGLLAGQTPNVTKKGTGFVQPLKPHQEWHVDVSYLNIAGTFYFLCSVLDGYSRFIVHWEIREKMEEIDVETILQRAREVSPRRHATHHLRQRPAVHRQGLQGVHPHRRHDPCAHLVLIIRRATARSNASTKPSRAIASASRCRCRSRTPAASSPTTCSITTTSACTAPSATSRPTTRSLGNDEAIHAERDRKLAEARERRKADAANPARSSCETGAESSRPAIDFAAVRAAITIAQVLALLGFVPRSDHAGQQRGACPLHGSTRGTARCFSVNTNAHTFHCFKCNRSGNALDLWAAANRLSIYDAALDLCQRLNIPLPLLAPPPTAEQRRGNRSHWFKHLYNPLSVSRATLSTFVFQL